MEKESEKPVKYKGTPFQVAVQKLTLEEFRVKTNIEEIVRNDFNRKYPDKKDQISEETMAACIDFYYQSLKKVKKWGTSSLKDLILVRQPIEQKKEVRFIVV